LPRQRWSSLAPVILAGALIVSVYYSLPFEKSIDMKKILGIWEGEFTWMDKTKSFPISVVFNADGTYRYDSVLRRSDGKTEIWGRKIFLVEEGLIGLSLTFDPNNGKPVLLGKLKELGTYRLSKLN
jgi:hypothetical protein